MNENLTKLSGLFKNQMASQSYISDNLIPNESRMNKCQLELLYVLQKRIQKKPNGGLEHPTDFRYAIIHTFLDMIAHAKNAYRADLLVFISYFIHSLSPFIELIWLVSEVEEKEMTL